MPHPGPQSTLIPVLHLCLRGQLWRLFQEYKGEGCAMHMQGVYCCRTPPVFSFRVMEGESGFPELLSKVLPLLAFQL